MQALARIIHETSAAAADPRAASGRTRLGRFNILQVCLNGLGLRANPNLPAFRRPRDEVHELSGLKARAASLPTRGNATLATAKSTIPRTTPPAQASGTPSSHPCRRVPPRLTRPGAGSMPPRREPGRGRGQERPGPCAAGLDPRPVRQFAPPKPPANLLPMFSPPLPAD